MFGLGPKSNNRQGKIADDWATLKKKYLLGLETGEIRFILNGVTWYGFIVENKKHLVSLHYSNMAGDPLKFFIALKKQLQEQNRQVLMLTNAGMYKPNYKPVGLFIEQFNKLCDLDTKTTESEGNFYIQPNGVFWIGPDQKFHIETTTAFIKNRLAQTENGQNKTIQYATQSGPMVVIKGKINQEFVNDSKNKKIRSGVGLVNGNKVVFLCTADRVSFHDFARAFADIFGCTEALYLDGAVSRMYLPGLNNNENGLHYGAMIAVTERK